MKHTQIIVTIFLLITFTYSNIDAQNLFPQTSIYKTLNITSINRSSSSTARSDPSTVTNDLLFILNNNGHVIKEIVFPGGKFEREKYKIYEADSLLVEEGAFGLRKKNLQSQKLYTYDEQKRLVEVLFYVSDAIRSTKTYTYYENSTNIKQRIEIEKNSKDTCYYKYIESRLDSINCTRCSKNWSELDDSIRLKSDYKTINYEYDSEKRLIREIESFYRGGHSIKEYSYPDLLSSGHLIRKETTKNNGRNKSSVKYKYNNLGQLVLLSKISSDPLQSGKKNEYKYYYDVSGLLIKKETTIIENTKEGSVKTTILKSFYDYQ